MKNIIKYMFIIIVVVGVVGGVTLLAVWKWRYPPKSASTDLAYVSWEEGGSRSVMRVEIVDSDNHPMPNVAVSYLSNSGWSPSVKTDNSGVAIIQGGELDVQSIKINGSRVMERPDAYWRNDPSLQNGLLVRIIVRDSVQLAKSVDHGFPP